MTRFCPSFIGPNFFLTFHSSLGQWSFKKNCFWYLLTFIDSSHFLNDISNSRSMWLRALLIRIEDVTFVLLLVIWIIRGHPDKHMVHFSYTEFIRDPVGSTYQAYSQCFQFRISWILLENPFKNPEISIFTGNFLDQNSI